MFGLFKKKSKKPSRDDIIAQAKQNAAKARAEIGQENLDRIARALMDENKSEGLKARDEIRKMDQAHVADNLKITLREDK
ncbi:MAG: hypothetical protein H6867_01770 [Rhodospirillales bacterium]|nr:hypothetical protein [Rhodospirillales bacterium]MCB9997246.1 hypothetical protein [Rhodospirillales bacterium]